MNSLDILLVDDDLLAARLLKAQLDRPGRITLDIAGSAEEGFERFSQRRFQAVVTDLMMGGGADGLRLLQRIREVDATVPVVVLTAHASLERAVEAIRLGATDFLQKPPNVGALLALLERAVQQRPWQEEALALRERWSGNHAAGFILGAHPKLDAVRQFAEQVAAVPEGRILITGETGTGKSLLARAIHELGESSGRFMEVNCAALPGALLESELFGHEAGAFTDARTMKRGIIEHAHKGTLLLDEIGAMPLELQAKLLLFLENREIRRVGGTEAIPVRCRVVAATHEDLRRMVRERTFRQDLLYRLDVASIEMPALREVPETIADIAEHFVRSVSADLVRPLPQLDADSFAALRAHQWPGNVRELRNAVERALMFHSGSGPLRVPAPVVYDDEASGPVVALPLGMTLDEVERRYITATLEREEAGDLAGVAERLGISRKTLWDKRRRFGI
jgi:two-component system, NtrC family, response regulator AtoC